MRDRTPRRERLIVSQAAYDLEFEALSSTRPSVSALRHDIGCAFRSDNHRPDLLERAGFIRWRSSFHHERLHSCCRCDVIRCSPSQFVVRGQDDEATARLDRRTLHVRIPFVQHRKPRAGADRTHAYKGDVGSISPDLRHRRPPDCSVDLGINVAPDKEQRHLGLAIQRCGDRHRVRDYGHRLAKGQGFRQGAGLWSRRRCRSCPWV